MHSSGDIHRCWSTYHQSYAKQCKFLQLALEPVTFSDRDLAEVSYSGIEVV